MKNVMTRIIGYKRLQWMLSLCFVCSLLISCGGDGSEPEVTTPDRQLDYGFHR